MTLPGPPWIRSTPSSPQVRRQAQILSPAQLPELQWSSTTARRGVVHLDDPRHGGPARGLDDADQQDLPDADLPCSTAISGAAVSATWPWWRLRSLADRGLQACRGTGRTASAALPGRPVPPCPAVAEPRPNRVPRRGTQVMIGSRVHLAAAVLDSWPWWPRHRSQMRRRAPWWFQGRLTSFSRPARCAPATKQRPPPASPSGGRARAPAQASPSSDSVAVPYLGTPPLGVGAGRLTVGTPTPRSTETPRRSRPARNPLAADLPFNAFASLLVSISLPAQHRRRRQWCRGPCPAVALFPIDLCGAHGRSRHRRHPDLPACRAERSTCLAGATGTFRIVRHLLRWQLRESARPASCRRAATWTTSPRPRPGAGGQGPRSCPGAGPLLALSPAATLVRRLRRRSGRTLPSRRSRCRC